MKKFLFPLGMVLILLLSACAQATATPTTKPTDAVVDTAVPTKVSTQTGTATCKLAQLLPDPAQLPPLTDGDWSKGNKNADVVLIEYSDFQ